MVSNDDLVIQEVKYLDNLRRFGKKMPASRYEVLKSLEDKVSRIQYNGSNCILKSVTIDQAIAGKASADMYRSIGILTPMIRFFERNDKHFIDTIQKDVSTINGVETILANDSTEFLEFQRGKFYGHDKWEIFKNEKLKSSLLSFMTNDCLEQLQNVYLVDELRTDTDRRYKNFFLWKNPDSEKYEGVIAIDLDEMIILNHCCAGWYDFKNFISFDYPSTTVRQKQDNRCYKYRMDDLRELIQSGYLSDKNIEILKKALNYDFPKEMEKLCNKRLMQGKQKKLFLDPVKQLWEYNNQTVGKELE